MSTKHDDFPLFRQLVGGKHLYRIDAHDRFVDLQRIGKRWVRHVVIADAYPEKVRIVEMIELAGGHYLPLERSVWDEAESGLHSH